MKWNEVVDLFVADKQSEFGAAPEPTVSAVGEGSGNSTSNSFFSWLTRGVELASDVQSALNPPNTPSSTTPGTTKTTTGASWLPWVLGGGAVLLVLFFVIRKR